MEKFVVSARKYRPSIFDSVIGQQHVTETLKNAIKNDHLAQSFLFCGPRGVGKTTCARILAKTINCTNLSSGIDPCNQCESCQAFNNNAVFNIYELDAASNNSVEDIRNLIEQVRYAPQSGKYKVYIIDEVHMLSQSAFNAFLKTLEEPPEYAIFILATTEKHKIIPTILSRCQIFDFHRIKVEDIVGQLEQIATKENLEAEQDALYVVAQKSDGALRDALSIFDKIVSFSGKISYKDVVEHLNILDYDYYFEATTALLTQDKTKALLLFNEVLNKGFEGDDFIVGLSEHYRNLLVCKEEQTVKLLEALESLQERYKEQAKIVPSSFLLNALHIANQCDVNYKASKNKRLHVELALIKMCYLNSFRSTDNEIKHEAVRGDSKKKQYNLEETPVDTEGLGSDPKLEESAENDFSSNIPSFKIRNSKVEEASSTEEYQSNGIKIDEANKKEINQINQEQLGKAWVNYSSMILKEGKNNLHSLMDMSKPILTDANGSFEVRVVNEVNKAMLNEMKENILSSLGDQLHNAALNMEVIVETNNDNIQAVPYTDKEKFNKMVDKNSALNKLKQQFDLEIEF